MTAALALLLLAPPAASGSVTIAVAPEPGAGPLPAKEYGLLGGVGATFRDAPAVPATAAPGGGAELTVRFPPGEAWVRPYHPDFAFRPLVARGVAVAEGATAWVAVAARPRATFAGRPVDAAGRPRGGAPVLVEGRAAGGGWELLEVGETGADGRFAVRPGVGPVRVVPKPLGGFRPVPSGPFDLPAGGLDVGESTAARLPTLAGTVVGEDGRPVPHALIGPGEESYGNAATVRCDAAGRFALAPDAANPSPDRDDGGGGFFLDLVAFDPAAPRSGAVRVAWGDDGPGPVRLTLRPVAIPPPPAAERESEAGPAVGAAAPGWAASAAFAPDGSPGGPAPILEGHRGRWVLLDFRTTWCGLCRLSEPTLHALAAAYPDRLAIVECYDASEPAAAIAEHLADRPAAGAVFRDAGGDGDGGVGVTAAAYGVTGFPTRVLLDPAGRVRLTSGVTRHVLRSALPATVRAFFAAEDAAAPPPPAVTLAGAVSDAAGDPVAATVTAVPLDDPAAAVTGKAGPDGRFALPGLPRDRTTLHAVCADGRAGWGFVVTVGDDARIDGAAVTVGPVGGAVLDVLAPDGPPAAGARLAGVHWSEGGGEEHHLTPASAAAAGFVWDPAGADGRLRVAGLPAGAAATFAVERPGSYRVESGPIPVDAGGEAAVPTLALKPGGRLELRLVPVDPAVPVPADGWALRARGGGPRGLFIVDEPWPAAADPGGGPDGSATLSVRLPPGEAFWMVTHPDFAAVPRYEYAADLAAGGTLRRTLRALPRATVTGRVTDGATGEPIPLASVHAYTRVPAAAGDPADDRDGPFGPDRVRTGSDQDLGEDGRFAVRAGVGEVRLSVTVHPVFGAKFPATTPAFPLTADGADAGDVAVFPLPTLTGTVVDAAGNPVPHAFVGPGANLEYRSQTVRADADGAFALPIGGLPEGDGERFAADLVAFPAEGPGFAAVTVELDPGGANEPLRVALDDSPVPAPPAPTDGWRDYAEPETPAPGDPAPPAAFAAGFRPDGTPDPDPPTLERLRGRWVLLDLRTTWCAPCRTSEPTVAAVAEAYADRLTVLEVYGTSDTPAAVADYLADRPAAGPVLRDAADGAAHRAWGVRGVPTRALIDPAGVVRLHSDYGHEALRPRLAATVRAFLAAEGAAGAKETD